MFTFPNWSGSISYITASSNFFLVTSKGDSTKGPCRIDLTVIYYYRGHGYKYLLNKMTESLPNVAEKYASQQEEVTSVAEKV